VSKSEGERSGATHHLALEVVLGAVARAHELVLGLIPGHDTSKVSAHSVDTIVLDSRVVILDNQVGGITLLQ